MKIFLIISLAISFVFKEDASAKICDANSKNPLASAFYYDKKYDLEINLGEFFIENSNIIFNPYPYEKHGTNIWLRDNDDKINIDAVIKNHKKTQLVKSILRKDLIKSLSEEVKDGSVYFTPPSNKYLDVNTKKVNYVKLRFDPPKVCDDHFLKSFSTKIYKKYGILIISE